MRLKLGFTKPKQPILGFEMAGQVAGVGRAVTRFRPGDRVVASRGFKFGCPRRIHDRGRTGAIATIPEQLSYEDAVSLCFGGSTALVFFRVGELAAGETVLINGASGAVGTMAVQLAKHLGAEVTGVCSGAHAELVSGLGADHVIDYTSEDFTRNGQRYDVIMDNHGNAPYARVKDSLQPGGRFLMVVGDLPQMLAATLAEGDDRPQPERLLDDRRKVRNPDVARRAGSAEAGDRFGPAVRADRRSASPGRRRSQGRQRRARLWRGPLNRADRRHSRARARS